MPPPLAAASAGCGRGDDDDEELIPAPPEGGHMAVAPNALALLGFWVLSERTGREAEACEGARIVTGFRVTESESSYFIYRAEWIY